MRFVFDDFVFDEERYELSLKGAALKVDVQVLSLLAYLLRHPGRLVTKEEIIDEVWQGRALGDNVISVCVAKLRKVLGGDRNRSILSVYGRGYRFLLSVQQDVAATTERKPEAGAVPSAAPNAMTSGVSAANAAQVPFVGRKEPLARLRSALTRAQSGKGAVCALLGEAGIGKTRVAEVFEDSALASGARVSWAHCHAFGDVPPLWPWLQVVRACEGELPAELKERSFDADSGVRDHDVDAHAHVEASGEPRVAFREVLDWMSRVVARLCENRSWVVVLEDMQWADAASLELLAHLTTQTAQHALLIVLTVRDTELPDAERNRRALDYVLGHRNCERIALERLPADDVAAYTSQLLGGTHSELAAAVYAKSEGNPFFMAELLRPSIESGAYDASELTLSGSALDIVRQGLRRLSSEARSVLGAAAVVGRGFDLGLLSMITGRPAEALLETLEDAMSRQVIVAARDSTALFAFAHDLIRSVLYDDLGPSMRSRLHQRVADAIEARANAGDGFASAELAHHLLRALPSGDVLRAVRCARRVAHAAVSVGAYADASVLLRRAVDALRLQPDADPKLLSVTLFELANNERAAGETYAAHFAESVEIARHHRLGTLLAAAGQRMSAGPGTLLMQDASATLEAALAALPEAEHKLRANVLAQLSWTPPHSTDAAKVAALLQEAEHEAERSGDPSNTTLLRAKLYYAGGPGQHERVQAIAAQLEEASVGDAPLLRARRALEPQIARTIALLQRGDLAQAQRVVDVFGQAAGELQHAELIWHYDRMCTVLRMNRGDFEHAKIQLTALKQRAEALQLHAHKVVEAIDWLELLYNTTSTAPFAPLLSRVLRADPSDSPVVRGYKITGLVRLGLRDEASAALAAVTTDYMKQLPMARDHLPTLGHLAFACAALHSLEHAPVLYELLSPYPSFQIASLSFHCSGVVSHYLGLLAQLCGDHVRAEAHFEHAILEQARVGLEPHLARGELALAQLLAAPERRDRARQQRATLLLEQVIERTTRLGMEPLRLEATHTRASLETKQAI